MKKNKQIKIDNPRRIITIENLSVTTIEIKENNDNIYYYKENRW